MESPCIPHSAGSLECSPCNALFTTLVLQQRWPSLPCIHFSLSNTFVFSPGSFSCLGRKEGTALCHHCMAVGCLLLKTLVLLRWSLRSSSCPTSQLQANSLASYLRRAHISVLFCAVHKHTLFSIDFFYLQIIIATITCWWVCCLFPGLFPARAAGGSAFFWYNGGCSHTCSSGWHPLNQAHGTWTFHSRGLYSIFQIS